MSPRERAELIGRRTADWFDSTWLTRAMKIAAVISLLLCLIIGTQQIRLNSCVVAWIDENSRISQQRTEAAAADRTALDQMVTAITSATSGADTRAALERYLQTRAEADEQRRRNPLPDAPSTVC